MVLKYLRVFAAWLLARLSPSARKRLAGWLFNAALAARGWPQMAGAQDDDGDGDGEGGGADDDDDGGSGSDDADDDGDDGDQDGAGGSRETDWKAMARKHERRAKAEKARADELAAKQAERDAENQSDHEKALAKAREEAAAEVTSKFEAERRADRLELATTRLATKGVKLGEDTVKFADPDDALAHLDRAIKRGDIDGDDIFDENGKVDKDALATALAELLEDKPHLRANNGSGGGSGEERRRGAGDADAGKGKGAGKSLEEMSPDDHLKAIQGR